jgi:putative membrane protein
MEEQRQISAPEGKHASDFLANERTFLAWIRTSVAVISLGFVIAKFRIWLEDLTRTASAPVSSSKLGDSFAIGIAMMALGGLLTLLAAWRYHVVNRQIELGKVTADRGLIVFVTLLVAALAGVMIVTMISTAGR